jgi:integrase
MRVGQLTAMKVSAIIRRARSGHTGDGGGLYLQISKYGTATWVFRYRVGGRLREAGLGSVDTWSLAEARERARKFRQMRGEGRDPIDERRAERARVRLETAKAVTFKAAAVAFIRAQAPAWKSPIHAAQWPSSLERYVFPTFGSLPVASVDTALVMKVLEPIWHMRPETASRVRQRIESVLNWAAARGYRQGENPARWKGHLDGLLPKPARAKAAARRSNGRDEHHAALPYREVPEFMRQLREVEGITARCLEFIVLAAARAGEARGARWPEFDEDGRLWVVPAERMKGGRSHRVPLGARGVEIVNEMAAIRSGDHVFPGRGVAPLSNAALLKLLRRMGRGDLTVHGFRSTFSDWVAERTNFPSEVREMALAHAVGDKVEAAYRRGDLFEKRRQLAEAWANYCATPPAAERSERVVPLRRGVL